MAAEPVEPAEPPREDPTLYPVHLRLAGRPVLVVGGGTVALSKVRGLLAAGAEVTVVAPQVAPELAGLPVTVHQRPYARGEAAGYRLVVACTDDQAVNQAAFDDGEAAGVWVNAADDPERCSYILPARLDRGPLVVTVSTSGRSPAFAAWLRDELALVLGPEHDALLQLLADERTRRAGPDQAAPAASWRRALDSGMLELLRTGQVAEAEALLRASLDPDAWDGRDHR